MRHAFALCLVTSVACGPSSGAIDSGLSETCTTEGQQRCDGQMYQICQGGVFVTQETCDAQAVCVVGLGCAECDPNFNSTCVGDDIYVCNDNGTVGGYVDSCPVDQCSFGTCHEDCGEATQLIYVVDESYNLHTFDPELLPANPFSLIGGLDCPAEFLATPFSMSVDREGTAWVLYSSGEIFKVSTEDASCAATNFSVGQQGFELFGMGFVSNENGGSEESLFIAGGDFDQLGALSLGTINTQTLGVSKIATLPTTEYGPELTGTGAGELYGYFPGSEDTFVARINKSNASLSETWPLPALNDDVVAWAFAHWGGDFYIFVTTGSFSPVARVLKLDPDSGNVTTVLNNTGKIVVGAGVSTCAPVEVD